MSKWFSFESVSLLSLLSILIQNRFKDIETYQGLQRTHSRNNLKFFKILSKGQNEKNLDMYIGKSQNRLSQKYI